MVHRGGRNHDMDPAPLRKLAVDHRRRSVDPQPEWGDNPFDQGIQVALPGKTCVDPSQFPAAVDPDLIRTVDQGCR